MLATGKSLELLGLATFNIILAMTLGVTFLGNSDKNTLNKLTEANVGAFINEVSAISSGQKKGMDPFGVTEYLMKHIEDGSTYTTTLQYDLDSADKPPEQKMDMDKKNYIGHVLENLKTVAGFEATTHIENIDISDGATQAKVVTTSYERGIVPMQTESGEPAKLPIQSISYCEQTLLLKNKTIRMDGAVCSTSIKSAGDQDPDSGNKDDNK